MITLFLNTNVSFFRLYLFLPRERSAYLFLHQHQYIWEIGRKKIDRKREIFIGYVCKVGAARIKEESYFLMYLLLIRSNQLSG